MTAAIITACRILQITMVYSRPVAGADTIARVVDMIATRGYAVAPEFLDRGVVAALRANALRFDRAGSLFPAAVGRGPDVLAAAEAVTLRRKKAVGPFRPGLGVEVLTVGPDSSQTSMASTRFSLASSNVAP